MVPPFHCAFTAGKLSSNHGSSTAQLRSGRSLFGTFSLDCNPQPLGTALPISRLRRWLAGNSLRRRLQARWMHLPPTPGKRASLEIYPPVGGANPYLIMSYQPTYRNARNLTGGLTLMMSFADVPKDRVPETRDDPGIYTNAVIYVGFMLYDDYTFAHATSKQERIASLVNALDAVWERYFRWAILAELDSKIEALISAGKTPTGAQISEIYLKLLRDYYGADQPSAVDEVFSAEWTTFSIPFLSYEYQVWPAAMAAAAEMKAKLNSGDVNGSASTELMGRSDNDRTYQLLLPVGIDMAAQAPYQALMRRTNRQLDELERLINTR